MLTTIVDNYPKLADNSAVKLKQARADLEDQKISQAEYENVQNTVTTETIKEQESAGLDLVTDGQIKWDDQQSYFTMKMDGFVRGDLIRYFDTNFLYRRPVLKSEPKKKQNFVTDDFKFAKSIATKPVKAVLIGPYSLAKFCIDEYFQNEEKFVLTLAEFLADEIKQLEQAGASIIQINEPWIVRENINFDLFQKALDKLVAAKTSSKLLLYTWFGKIAPVWDKLTQLPVDGFGIDFCRYPENFDFFLSSTFPVYKELGLGLIDAQNTKLDSVEGIKQRINQISQKISLDKTYLNPSTFLEYLPRDKALKKIQLLTEIKKSL